MSIHAVEKVFWEFGDDPGRVERFKSDPDTYLKPYNLTNRERQSIKDVNLKDLVELGVSPLLTVMTWPMLNGPEGMPMSYLKHMAGD